MTHIRLLLVAACFVIPNASMPAYGARPFYTDDAGTVQVGKFELETAFDFWKGKAAAGLGLKHGITERMDIGIGIGYVPAPDEERAFTGADLGIKFVWVPDVFATSFGTEFASGTYSVNAILSKSSGPVSWDANLGFEAISNTNDADLTCGLAAVYTYRKLGIGAEIGGTHEALNWWQIGVRLRLSEWVQVDAGLGGNDAGNPDLTATAGLWFAFPMSE